MTGKEIRVLRVNLDLNQQEMAEKIGVSRATLSVWENKGRDDIPLVAQNAFIGLAAQYGIANERWRA